MSKITPKKRVLFVRRFTPVALALFGVFSLVATNLHHTQTAYAVELNQTVNFQARLQTAVGAIVPDDTYNIQFKLYDVSTGGTALWTETYLNSNSQGLSTVNGYFSTALGSVTAFSSTIPWGHQLWLTMNIGGTGTSASWDGEMNPRMQLTAIPYAFQAGELTKSNSDGSITSNLSIQAPTGGDQNFVIQDQGAAGTYNLLTKNQGDANYIQLQTGTPSAQTGSISVTGSISSASLSTNSIDRASSGTLTIGGTNADTITIGKTASNTSTVINGTTTIKTTSGNDSAAAFQVQKAAGGTPVFDVDTANGRVGVGTASPGRTLDVAVNNSNTTTSTTMARLMQGGSGDATLELATTDNNYYIGIDESAGGAFKISSATASDPTHTGAVDTFSKALFTLSNTGAAIFQNSVDSATALQVTNAAGTAYALNVDTTNTRVGIGTNAPNRTLDVATNTSSTTNLPVLVEQAGTGNVGIEMKNASQSYYIGIDSSDNTFKVNSSVAAAATGSSTNTTMGAAAANTGFTDTGDYQAIVGTQFIAPASGTITSLSAYVASPIDSSSNNKGRMALYSDSGLGSGTSNYDIMRPGTIIAASTETALTGNAWNTFTISSTSVTAGTRYWLVYITNASVSTKNNLVGGDTLDGHSTIYMANTYNSGSSGFPSSWSGSSAYEGEYGVRATIVTSGFTPDGTGSFNDSLFKINATGQAQFRNSTDSTTAFTIQSANSTSILNVDTSNEQVRIGSSSGDGLGALLILGSKTSSGDPTYVAGAMYYNATMGSFRCGQGGIWVSCIGGLLSVSSGTGTTDSNSVSETTISPTYTIPANYCANNRVLRLTANGTYKTTGTPTLTLKIKVGGITITPDTTTMTTQSTSKGWTMSFTVICPNAAGSSVAVTTQGLLTMANDANRQIAYVSNTLATNTQQTLSITATWGTASTSNSITLNSFTLEGMGP